MSVLPMEACQEMIDREFRPSPTRLGIQPEARQRRSVAREWVTLAVYVFWLLCALYVAIGGVIGFVQGAWSSLNALCAAFLRLVGAGQ